MDGKKLESRMKRLSEITAAKEIPQLTYAVFPGHHCPLMGAMMAVRGIADAILLVIGTDECTYYTKQSTIHNENFGGLNGRCVSLVLGQRLGNFPDTELYRMLTASGVEMGMMLPSGTDVAEIKRAASAKVNIIVNPIGLPLAKKMEKAFGTPYVLFDKYVKPAKNLRALSATLFLSANPASCGG